MKLVMTLYVRNEADIIQHNIEFHKSVGVDFFIVTDNLSTDATAEILKHYEKQGILEYHYSDRDDYAQAETVTMMARRAATEYNADWVINNDADEFWYPNNHSSLKDIIVDTSPHFHGIRVERHNFVPIKHYADPFYSRMIYKQKTSTNWLGNPLEGKVMHRGNPEVSVRQGNHRVDGFHGTHALHTQDIDILHFTARSFDTWKNRMIASGKAYENSNHPEHLGTSARSIYSTYKSGQIKDFYSKNYYSRLRLLRETKKGNLIKDTRLRDHMKNIYS